MRRFLALALVTTLLLLAAACGGQKEETATPETVEGNVPEETVAEGDAAAGEEVYNSASPACGSCHTFEAAGTSAEVGPNLDESLGDMDAQQVLEAIVNPDAEVAEGYQAGIMPKTYGEDLDDKQLADLVAFLTES